MPPSAQEVAQQALNLVRANDLGALDKLLSRTPAAWKSEVLSHAANCPVVSRTCLDVMFRHGLTASTMVAGTVVSEPLLHYIVRSGRLDVVRYLVEQRKADLEVRDDNGYTALMLAAHWGYKDIASYLLDRGADIHAHTVGGNQAIHDAAMEGVIDVLALLLDRGADINAAADDGNTPLIFAALMGNMDAARLLLDRGASETLSPTIIVAAIGSRPDSRMPMVELLLSRGRDINATDSENFNALDYAIRQNLMEMAVFLLDRGITLRTHEGKLNPPILAAAAFGNIEILRLLLDRGLPVLSARDNHGFTCLHGAAEGNQVETLRLLLDRGMGVDVRAYDGCTPLHIAIMQSATKCVRLLLERGASLEAYARIWEDKRKAATPLIAAAACCRDARPGVHPVIPAAIFRFLLNHIDRSEDPGRILTAPCSDGFAVQSYLGARGASESPALAELHNLPFFRTHDDTSFISVALLRGDFNPTTFSFWSVACVSVFLNFRKTTTVLPTDWSSTFLRLLDLFPSHLRPFERELDAVCIEALANTARHLRRQLHQFLPSQCGRDWTANRLAWFRAGRVVQRRMKEVLGGTRLRGLGSPRGPSSA